MDDIGIFLVFLGRDPHLHPSNGISASLSIWHRKTRAAYLLERAQSCQDRSADPGRVLSLGRSIDLQFDVLECDPLDLVQQSITEA